MAQYPDDVRRLENANKSVMDKLTRWELAWDEILFCGNFWQQRATAALQRRDVGQVKGKGFPLQAWRGSWGSRRLRLLDLLNFWHCECGKVVTLTHRPPSPPGISWYSFLEAELTPGHGSVGSLGKNPQRHHWGLIPRPSD
jgi:hypothetical protein